MGYLSHDTAVCLQVAILENEVSWLGELSQLGWHITSFLGLIWLPLTGWRSRKVQFVVQQQEENLRGPLLML